VTTTVDDNAIDGVIRKRDGSFIENQIKARSNAVIIGDGALFAAIPHEYRENYYFIFFSERLNTFFVMSSREFIDEAVQNKSGKDKGERSIWFNGKKKGKEYIKDKYKEYVVTDFSCFK